MDDLTQFRDLFFDTTRKHIEKIKSILDDLILVSDIQKLTELHLHLHSLKGEIYIMQYTNFGDYVTILEKYIKGIIEKKGILSSESNTLIQKEIEEIAKYLDFIKTENKEPDDVVSRSKNLRKGLGIVL